MKYKNIKKAIFKSRPNRFIAVVSIGGEEETVHVKNTGRCAELLIPGSEVILSRSDNRTRKTEYDLVAVYKQGLGLVNIDSQAPNRAVKEWLATKRIDKIQPEYKYGHSRIDFYLEQGDRKVLLEVKG
ncbi:MAG: DNA/RNA nuclease SfsA, partial [Eubacteriales bacterium]|nr:DNA/RNA nuclease SfsA [Eubacteriales bacterium]